MPTRLQRPCTTTFGSPRPRARARALRWSPQLAARRARRRATRESPANHTAPCPAARPLRPTAMRSREPRRRRARYEVVHEDLAAFLVDVDDERVRPERRRERDEGAPACVDVASAARRKGNGAKASRPSPCERNEHDEEVGDYTQQRLRRLPQPPPFDAEAEQTLRANDLRRGCADGGGAQAGDDLHILDRPDEDEPENEQDGEPRQPRSQTRHGRARTPRGFPEHLRGTRSG